MPNDPYPHHQDDKPIAEEAKKAIDKALQRARQKRPGGPIFVGLIIRPPEEDRAGARPNVEPVNQVDLIAPE